MSKVLANNYRHRRSFAITQPSVDIDNLISIQVKSYNNSLKRAFQAMREKMLDFKLYSTASFRSAILVIALGFIS